MGDGPHTQQVAPALSEAKGKHFKELTTSISPFSTRASALRTLRYSSVHLLMDIPIATNMKNSLFHLWMVKIVYHPPVDLPIVMVIYSFIICSLCTFGYEITDVNQGTVWFTAQQTTCSAVQATELPLSPCSTCFTGFLLNGGSNSRFYSTPSKPYLRLTQVIWRIASPQAIVTFCDSYSP